MEDGGSPSIGILVFLVFVLIDALFYGFGAALQAINNKQVEERAQSGDKKAMKLKAMMDNPIPFIKMCIRDRPCTRCIKWYFSNVVKSRLMVAGLAYNSLQSCCTVTAFFS